MPIKRLRISCKTPGARGTEQAPELLQLMYNEWDNIMEIFNNNYATEDAKLELICHLNARVEELGETLFGSDNDKEIFADFVRNLDKEK